MAKSTQFEPVRVFQNVQDVGAKLMAESNLLNDEIQQRLAQLAQNWDELKDMTSNRGQKLDESLAFQQFAANVEEEEAWITEKQHLLSGEDLGDTLAAVQGLLKKHDAFETDFNVHLGRCQEITKEGDKLIQEVSAFLCVPTKLVAHRGVKQFIQCIFTF